MLEPRKLNFQKFKSLLESHNNGTNKINFKFFLENKEIEIKSEDNYKIDIEFMNKIKSIEGVTFIKKIN